MASSLPDIDYRILLIGRTGHGKSSTGNTIVGKYVFNVSDSSKSLTRTCQWSEKVKRFGKIVEVVDTPGIFDTELSGGEVHRELLKAVALSTPGFHVIAFVLMKGKFTEEIQKTQEIFFDWFGEGVENFACVILTDTDNEKAKHKFIYDDPHEKLTHLVEACGGNVVALHNLTQDKIKEEQVKTIFNVIDRIKEKNAGKYFTNVAFQLANAYIMNKYPLELTEDSILILEKAGLKMNMSGEQCQYLDRLFSLKTNAATATVQTSKASKENATANAETNNKSKENATGNIPIFDGSTNERISNTRRANQSEQPHVENLSSSDATFSDTSSDSELSLSSQVSEVPGKTAVYEQSLKLEDEVTGLRKSEEVESSSDQINHNAKVKKPSSRTGRKYVSGSARYDIPSSPTTALDTFKSNVNNETNSEELKGLSGYLKKAWCYCKEKIRKCILL